MVMENLGSVEHCFYKENGKTVVGNVNLFDMLALRRVKEGGKREILVTHVFQ